MSERFYDYDPAEMLDREEAIAMFLADAQETGNPEYVARAKVVAERARRRIKVSVSTNQDEHFNRSE